MNKNTMLFLLFIAALLGSTWGSVVNRQKIDLEQQLRDARTELQKCSEQPGLADERLPGAHTALQASLAEKEEQLEKARKELAALRKEKQALEAKLSGSGSGLQVKSGLPAEAADPGKTAGAPQKSGGEGGAGQEGGASPGELQRGGSPVEDAQRLEEVNAQLLGLEKIVDEKNLALQQIVAEKERLLINMDVLLAKIADQQRELLAIQEEKRELVKQLAARKELTDFQ